MGTIKQLSWRRGVSAIAAVLLACSLGSAHAAVVFSASGTDSVIDQVLGTDSPVLYFTISEPGTYRATLTDLSTSTDFVKPFDLLQMLITTAPVFSPQGGPVSAAGGEDSVEFVVTSAGSFAAMVQAISGAAGTLFSGYQVRVTSIPEPAIWLMLATGLGLLGFVRIRRAAHNGI